MREKGEIFPNSSKASYTVWQWRFLLTVGEETIRLLAWLLDYTIYTWLRIQTLCKHMAGDSDPMQAELQHGLWV